MATPTKRLLTAAVAWATFQSSLMAPSSSATPMSKMDPRVQRAIARSAPDDELSVIVRLKRQADMSTVDGSTRRARLREVVETLQQTAEVEQDALVGMLRSNKRTGDVSRFAPLWVINAVAVTATPKAIEAIARRVDVGRISLDQTIVAPGVPGNPGPPEWGLERIRAPLLWSVGLTGEGVTVANMDTGVDYLHPDLANSYRGGANSWFDPNGEHPDHPVDVSGHGTWTMGVMVGGDAGGSSIGVAPGAKWIAVRIFDDSGKATVSGIHQGFQWLLDPDGDPATPDAPNVVNNSWSYGAQGCNLEFEGDLGALRAAGILPLFAAGGGGPGAGTDYSPANNPSAFALGSADSMEEVATDSSRGPSTCDGSIYPEAVAPGVGIRTSDLFDGYTSASGTSLAVPHAAGTLALLLEAFPNLSAEEQESALRAGAVDLGVAGSDNTYGAGRLDAVGSYVFLGGTPPDPPDPPDPPAPSDPALILSPGRGAPVELPGVGFASDEDLLMFDGRALSAYFDGSDVGLIAGGLDAAAVLDDRTLLLSLRRPAEIAGIGPVDDSDIVRFTARTLGTNTSGEFAMELDASDVGLGTRREDVDAVDLLGDGHILVSTTRWVRVPGVTATGADLLAFTPTSSGRRSAGSWELLLDASDLKLGQKTERIDAADFASADRLLLSTRGAFRVPSLSGGGADVIACSVTSFASDSACSFEPSLVFDGEVWGLGGLGVDAVSSL
jgi:subtilisin family serine protease